MASVAVVVAVGFLLLGTLWLLLGEAFFVTIGPWFGFGSPLFRPFIGDIFTNIGEKVELAIVHQSSLEMLCRHTFRMAGPGLFGSLAY